MLATTGSIASARECRTPTQEDEGAAADGDAGARPRGRTAGFEVSLGSWHGATGLESPTGVPVLIQVQVTPERSDIGLVLRDHRECGRPPFRRITIIGHQFVNAD
jgi:hypothetical protein